MGTLLRRGRSKSELSRPAGKHRRAVLTRRGRQHRRTRDPGPQSPRGQGCGEHPDPRHRRVAPSSKGGRIAVILCTNRLSCPRSLHSVRRAAIVEEFRRPSDAERRQPVERTSLGLGLSPRRRSANWSPSTGARDGKPSVDLLGLQKVVFYPAAHGDGVFPSGPLRDQALKCAAAALGMSGSRCHGGLADAPLPPVRSPRPHLRKCCEQPRRGRIRQTLIRAARELIVALLKALMKRGANFVVPWMPSRCATTAPKCFDWPAWKTIKETLALRPRACRGRLPSPLHHKNEDQIPPEYVDLWDELRSSSLVRIENAAQWNMSAKRRRPRRRTATCS